MAKKCPQELHWDWQRVMDWYGAEGSKWIGKDVRYFDIAQADRKVLDDMCKYMKTQGIKACPIHYDKISRTYHLRINRVEDQKIFIEKGYDYSPTDKVCDDLNTMEKAIKKIKPRKLYKRRKPHSLL